MVLGGEVRPVERMSWMWQGCVGHEGCDWVSEKREEQRRERKSVGGVLKRERRVCIFILGLAYLQ